MIGGHLNLLVARQKASDGVLHTVGEPIHGVVEFLAGGLGAELLGKRLGADHGAIEESADALLHHLAEELFRERGGMGGPPL